MDQSVLLNKCSSQNILTLWLPERKLCLMCLCKSLNGGEEWFLDLYYCHSERGRQNLEASAVSGDKLTLACSFLTSKIKMVGHFLFPGHCSRRVILDCSS